MALYNELKTWMHGRHYGHNYDAAVAVHEWALNWGLPVGLHVPEHQA